MDDILNYETYLLISAKKLVISVCSNSNKKIYYDESFINNNINFEIFKKLDHFLNKNIFKIEKKLDNFIEKITVILDLDIFFPVEISLKKNNHNDFINLNTLNYLLYEAKECCKKTIEQKKIIHMIINNYLIDDKNYSSLPKNIKCQNYSLDLKLICLEENLYIDLEMILKKYHISIDLVLSGKYIKDFCSTDDEDIFSMAKKISNGFNQNEVMMVNKTKQNQGFFEKFFNFFS